MKLWHYGGSPEFLDLLKTMESLPGDEELFMPPPYPRACGGEGGNITATKKKVTCKNCRRTKQFASGG